VASAGDKAMRACPGASWSAAIRAEYEAAAVDVQQRRQRSCPVGRRIHPHRHVRGARGTRHGQVADGHVRGQVPGRPARQYRRHLGAGRGNAKRSCHTVSRITILLIPVAEEAAMSCRLNPELAPRVANACFTHTPAPRHWD
jgi:hypothetical protein